MKNNSKIIIFENCKSSINIDSNEKHFKSKNFEINKIIKNKNKKNKNLRIC